MAFWDKPIYYNAAKIDKIALMSFIDKYWSVVINCLLLLVTLWIWISANKIAHKQNEIAEQQNTISNQQTRILQQQTDILSTQADIQNNALEFEKDKNRTDTAKEYREKIGVLYDKVTSTDEILIAVHNKIKNWEKIMVIGNLDRYVSEFENIGALYCDDKVKLADLKTILSDVMKYTCGNNQISDHYQNTKSWLSALCNVLYPDSNGIGKWVNPQKCVIIR